MKIRALYENGWHQGTIQWYNSKTDQYWVLRLDGIDDYIELDYNDGIEVILRISLSVCLSVCVSVCVPIYLSVCLSIGR